MQQTSKPRYSNVERYPPLGWYYDHHGTCHQTQYTYHFLFLLFLFSCQKFQWWLFLFLLLLHFFVTFLFPLQFFFSGSFSSLNSFSCGVLGTHHLEPAIWDVHISWKTWSFWIHCVVSLRSSCKALFPHVIKIQIRTLVLCQIVNGYILVK